MGKYKDMKSHGSFRPPINPKNHSKYSRGDLWKMCAPQRKRAWWHGTPKLPDDVTVGHINSTHHSTQFKWSVIGLAVLASVVSGGIGGDMPGSTDTPDPVYNYPGHNYDADTTTNGIGSCDVSDVSHNILIIEFLDCIGKQVVTKVDHISQRLSWGRR